ncbi:hypothetical protein CECT5772_03474 [Streptococcus equi subsp. ruminatorum CECT 5772]|uniref:Uncharacterized protein n=1 Tax=Streptococcus equi subsp. ruminatorum CECT 5772 TaxID=1051981 RepID=A0A922NUQ9_9STRE|nr:hypothetical protein CECT5772_03474 [Streptococcus equi subsp. ruminatorum CECT 5772]
MIDPILPYFIPATSKKRSSLVNLEKPIAYLPAEAPSLHQAFEIAERPLIFQPPFRPSN